MSKTLIVGDVHATPQELGDCRALVRLIVETVASNKVDLVVFLGDQHHNHNVLDSRVLDFWVEAMREIDARQVYLVGNHDQVSPTTRFPHSMVAHKGITDRIDVVDCAKHIVGTNFCAMPYYYDPAEFVRDAVELKQAHPQCDFLFCHQTFTGADASLGFHSDETVESSAIPFRIVISGHIHAPMRLGKVWYPGSPRWRSLKDADVSQRAIYLLEPGRAPLAIPTKTHCVRIYRFEDCESSPAAINLTSEELALSDIRVSVAGPYDYVSKRVVELRNKYHAKCRTVPVKAKLTRVSESDGIPTAFSKFCSSFIPPNGTDKQVLLQEAERRING